MAECADIHAMRRARERYCLNLTRQELFDAANIIKGGRAYRLVKHPGGWVYALKLRETWLFFLWGGKGKRSEIKSVVPPGKHYVGKLINRLKGEIEEGENEVERLYAVLAEVRGAFPLPRTGSDEDEESPGGEREEQTEPLDAWEEQIVEDFKAGRLDSLLEEALDDHRAGRTEPL